MGSLSIYISESPPSPLVDIFIASTIVFHPLISAPFELKSIEPSLSNAISVVVPPISQTIAVFSFARYAAPETLAAGPDKIVSTGRSFANSADTREPSPLTTINLQFSPIFCICCLVAFIRVSIRLISLAFKNAVNALFGPPSDAESS